MKEKTIIAKKLPGLLKKKYTSDLFEKKILKKIYIESDKKLIKSLFQSGKDEKGRNVVFIDPTKALSKSDFKRAKLIAKSVRAQKPAFKFVPFFATVGLTLVLILSVFYFKNIIIKNVIVHSMQKVFLAKTDVGNVYLRIFGGSLEVTSIAQADKDSPMKNLFEVERVYMDFNLSDLLRGKFHAENMEVTGVALGTDRESSGELFFAHESKEVKKLEKDSAKKSLEYANSASETLSKLFSNYDPENMLSGIQEDLKSPKVAESISADVTAKASKWKNVPAEYRKTVEKLSADVNEIANTDWSKVNDPLRIKNALEKIASVYKETESLKEKIKTTASEINADATAMNAYSKQIQTAIKSDTALVDSKISEMKKTFSPAGLKAVMNDAINSVLYSVSGKYYPYANMALNAAMNSKGSEKAASKAKNSKKAEKSDIAEKKAKKAKKTGASHKRSAGRNIYYKKDTVPRFLIENVKASGYEYKTNQLLFEASAEELSNDQNVRGKPATLKALFNSYGNINKIAAVVDSREDSSASLISAVYKGAGFPVEADAQVFKFTSASNISAEMSFDTDGSFAIGGILDLKIKDIDGMDFSPEKVSAIYNKSLKDVKNLSLGFKISNDDEGLLVEVTNLDKASTQIVAPLAKALTSELNAIADDAKKQVSELIAEKNSSVTSSISEFNAVQTSLSKEMASVNKLEKVLDQKKKELMAKTGADAAQDAANKLLKKLF